MLKGGFYSPNIAKWRKMDEKRLQTEITGAIGRDGRFDFRRLALRIRPEERVFVVEKGDSATTYVGWQQIGEKNKYLLKLSRVRKGWPGTKLEIVRLSLKEVCDNPLDLVSYVEPERQAELGDLNHIRFLILKNLHLFTGKTINKDLVEASAEINQLYDIAKKACELAVPTKDIPVPEVDEKEDIFVIEKGNGREAYIGWNKSETDGRKYMIKYTIDPRTNASKTELILARTEEVCNHPFDYVLYAEAAEKAVENMSAEVEGIAERNACTMDDEMAVYAEELADEEDTNYISALANNILEFVNSGVLLE